MDILAAGIFIGIPAVAIACGLVSAVAVMLRWHEVAPPALYYFADRIQSLPIEPGDEPWIEELDALRLPYRHTIC